MSSAIYPDPPRLVTAVCGHGEQQRLSNARLRLTFYNAPVAYCGPARPGSAFQQSAVSGLLPRARVGVASAEIWSPRPTLPIGRSVPATDPHHWSLDRRGREPGERGEKMVWEPDRFNARVAHRLRGRPRFELIKARDLESLESVRKHQAGLQSFRSM